MSTEAIHMENGGGEKEVPVTVHASDHAVAEKPRVLKRLHKIRLRRRVRQTPQHITMPHNIDAAPPSISEIWGETLTWGMALLALFSVILLALMFFVAMQFFSAGNSREILQEAQERLEETP